MKLKLSKTSLIFLAIGVFVILFASLGMVYSQRHQEQSLLNEELALAQLRLRKLSTQELASQQEELESRLAEVESQLRAAKISLDQSTQSIEASDALFELAADSYSEVTELSSPGVADEQIEGVTLPALSLTATVEGDVLYLIDFICQWTKEYPTGVVKTVEITVPLPSEEEAEEEEEETEEEKPSAIIDMSIYSYEGD